jgi:hypothetical protein
VSFRIDVDADPLNVEANPLELVTELADVMPSYFARQLLAGNRPEGGALPANKSGKPLGLGNGTIATQWWTTQASGNEQMAGFSTGPYQEGGHFYAVRAMVEAGASPVSSEGNAGALIDKIVGRAADRAVGL